MPILLKNYYQFENEEEVRVENYFLSFAQALRDRKVKCMCVCSLLKIEIVLRQR